VDGSSPLNTRKNAAAGPVGDSGVNGLPCREFTKPHTPTCPSSENASSASTSDASSSSLLISFGTVRPNSVARRTWRSPASITSPVSTVAIAIEVPHEPVADVLLDRGFCLYSINPKQLDGLRDRFSVGQPPPSPALALLPADAQAHRWRGGGLAVELWNKAPMKSTIERFLKQPRVRRIDGEKVLLTLRQPAINVADGVAAAACARIRSLMRPNLDRGQQAPAQFFVHRRILRGLPLASSTPSRDRSWRIIAGPLERRPLNSLTILQR
jgi:hypothetical protein